MAVWALSRARRCGICKSSGKLEQFPSSFSFIAPPHRPFDHVDSKRYCPSCAPLVEGMRRAILVAQNHDPLVSWPDTYKGRIPKVPGTEQPRIYSEFLRDREEAKSQLFLTTAYAHPECNAVVEIAYDKGTGDPSLTPKRG